MRDYIFRGKHAWGSRAGWVYGSLIQAGSYCCILDPDNEDDIDFPYLDDDLGTIDGKATPVIPETIGQFTGRVDKHGKRVFEGDIIRVYSTYMSTVGTIEWCGSAYEIANVITPDGKTYIWLHQLTSSCFEVIGNIHDMEDSND